MGRLYVENNGGTSVLFSNESVSGITPQTNTYFVGVDSNTGKYSKLNPNGDIIDLESASGGGGLITVTQSEFRNLFTNSGLTEGAFYKVTGVATSLYIGGINIIVQAMSSDSGAYTTDVDVTTRIKELFPSHN